MTRVCHLSSAHQGLDIRIFSKECASLAEAGFDTHLVINATALEVKDAAKKGVTVHALASPSGRFSRMLLQSWRCYKLGRKVHADVYHFHDPELIPYGVLLSISGKKVIYDVHEDLPQDILSKDWIPLWARKIVAGAASALEYIGARFFFSVIAATPFIAQRFQKINPDALNINNYPLADELAPASVKVIRKRQVCYVGAISRVRGVRPLVEALPLLPDMQLILCGRFAESDFESELRALPGWRQVEYLGQVGRDDVRKVMAESMAGIVTLFPIPNYLVSLPIKMFEYMSAGLPVIASKFPLWQQIIGDAGAGICVDPTSAEDIALKIRLLTEDSSLVEEMGQAGRRAILDKYNWPVEAKKQIEFYKALL